MEANVPILAGSTAMFLQSVGAGGSVDDGLVHALLTQYGPLGLFVVALWLMIRGKDAEMRELRGDIKEMHAQAIANVEKVTSAVEKNTAALVAVKEELSEVSSKLDDVAERFPVPHAAPSERSHR